ncbi:MAG: hypothetical protein HRF40_03845 [Nitrososphaera sp.]|jgi:hypothetical protein
MGQWEVYEAIRTLGGNVTARQIHEFLTSKDETHHTSSTKDNINSKGAMATTMLYIKRLCAAGLVAKSPCAGTRYGKWTYRIVGSYPERNVVVVATVPTGA